MNARTLSVIVALAVLAVTAWLFLRPVPPAPKNQPLPTVTNPEKLMPPMPDTATVKPLPLSTVPPALATAVPSGSQTPAGTAASPSGVLVPPGAEATPADGTPASTTDSAAPPRNPQTDAGKVKLMFRDFRTLMGENPVGTNAEIMHTLIGGNPRQATLGPPEGMTLNGNGELIDQWQTPYFFHQISKDVMEIRSAGPDKQMYTADDVVTR